MNDTVLTRLEAGRALGELRQAKEFLKRCTEINTVWACNHVRDVIAVLDRALEVRPDGWKP